MEWWWHALSGLHADIEVLIKSLIVVNGRCWTRMLLKDRLGTLLFLGACSPLLVPNTSLFLLLLLNFCKSLRFQRVFLGLLILVFGNQQCNALIHLTGLSFFAMTIILFQIGSMNWTKFILFL